MQTFKRYEQKLELHQIERRYREERFYSTPRIKQMIGELSDAPQRVPVVISQETLSKPFILMDGYLRFEALKRLGRDELQAEIWCCDPITAYSQLRWRQHARPLTAFENSLLLRRLQAEHNLSQNELAQQLGCTQSVISRQIALTQGMPEFIIEAIGLEQLSIWSGVRVLAPMARAIEAHAKQFVDYLKQNPHSTRDINKFYEHYVRETKAVKTQMVNEPHLFFKSLAVKQLSQQAQRLAEGPEGKWVRTLANIRTELLGLIAHIPHLFHKSQTPTSQQYLLKAFEETQLSFNGIAEHLIRAQHD